METSDGDSCWEQYLKRIYDEEPEAPNDAAMSALESAKEFLVAENRTQKTGKTTQMRRQTSQKQLIIGKTLSNCIFGGIEKGNALDEAASYQVGKRKGAEASQDLDRAKKRIVDKAYRERVKESTRKLKEENAWLTENLLSAKAEIEQLKCHIDSQQTTLLQCQSRNKLEGQLQSLLQQNSLLREDLQLLKTELGHLKHYINSDKSEDKLEDAETENEQFQGKIGGQLNVMQQSIAVFELNFFNDKAKADAMNIVGGFPGIMTINMNMEDRRLTLVGDIDPLIVVSRLSDTCSTRLLSFSCPFKTTKRNDGDAMRERVQNELAAAQLPCLHPQAVPDYHHVENEDRVVPRNFSSFY